MNVTVPDSSIIRRAVADADAHRGSTDGVRAGMAAHIDALVAELRDVIQAHADVLEAYGDLKGRISAVLDTNDAD